MSKQRKDRELAKNGAITEEAMLAYLNNELTVEEKQQFDKLLAEDAFAQDAMEGLQATQKAVVATHLSSINKKIKSKAGLREGKVVKIHWTNYAWAAAILGLLVGIGFVMIGYMNKNNNAIAENKKQDTETNLVGPSSGAAPAETPQVTDSLSAGAYTVTVTDANGSTAPMTDSVSVNPNMQGSFTATNAAPGSTGNTTAAKTPVTAPSALTGNNAANQTATTNIPTAKPVTVINTNATSTDKAAVAARSKTDDAKTTTTESANTKAKKAEEKNNTTADVAQTPKIGTVKDGGPASGGAAAPAVDPNVTIDQAMSNFNKGNYKESSAQFDVILKKAPDNKEALYFGGVSDYINGKTTKSEKNFDKLLNAGSGYTEGSKWYKANILIQKGKKEDAKKILNELSNGSGSYKERAANKLKEIN